MNADVDEEFERFVRARWHELFRYALALTGRYSDAEDLVQEALVKTGAAWSRIRRRDDPEGYVRRTMTRTHISSWRRARREWLRREVPERARVEPGHVRVDADVGLWRAVVELPPRQRAVLVLRYYQGLSEAEIAATLGVSQGTVKSQAARALAKLRAVVARPDEPVDATVRGERR